MSWLAGAMFIFGVGFGAMMTAWWLTGRPDRQAPRVPLPRLADPRPLPGEHSTYAHAAFSGAVDPPIAPFPDTGPLLIWSDSMAAAMAITREVEEMTRAAEWKARPWQ